MKSLSMLIVISFLIGCSNRKEAREAVNFSKIIVIGDLPEAIEECLAEGLTDFPDIRVNVAGAPQIIVHARVVKNTNHSFATLTAKTSDGITATASDETETDSPFIELIKTATFQLAASLRNQELERLTTPGRVGKENTTGK